MTSFCRPGVEIKSIQTYHHELNVKAGQQLLISCHFQTTEPLADNKIKLQWSVKPPDEDEFQPIYQIEDATRLTVNDINRRARMYLSDVRQGDCSLLIDPVHRDDGGMYDLRIAINGDEFRGDTRVDVHIRESRVKIKSVQTYHHELNTTVGQQLIIPCHFNLDKPLSNNLVLLKWSMRPIGEDTFHPIIKVYDTKLLPVEHPTRNVWVDVAQVRQGICSLWLNPVHLNDSGTYEVRLAINGDEFPGHTRVNIYVKESDTEIDPNQPMKDEESQSRKASENEDLDLMRMADVVQVLKDNGTLIVMGICGGLLLLIILLGMVLTIYFGCRYCRLKHKAVDEIKQMEEGRLCGLQVPTTYVSNPMENWHEGSTLVDNWQKRSAPADHRHKGSAPEENRHKGSTPAENQHSGSILVDNRHRGSTPAENQHSGSILVDNRHRGSTPAENQLKGSTPIPTSSQVKVADPPPLMTAEERQRVLKRVRSRVRNYVKFKKKLKRTPGGK
ncbi:uncharacterized protein LOC143986762 [Lithobates pipiens]